MRTDLRSATAHLNQAVRHLATSRAIVEHLDDTAALSTTDREELGDLHSTAAKLLTGIEAAVQPP